MLASKLCTDVVLRVQAHRPPPALFAQEPSSFLVSGRCRLRVLVDKASVSTLPRLAIKLSRCWPAPSSPRCQQAAPSPAMTGAPLVHPGPSSLQATRARCRSLIPPMSSCIVWRYLQHNNPDLLLSVPLPASRSRRPRPSALALHRLRLAGVSQTSMSQASSSAYYTTGSRCLGSKVGAHMFVQDLSSSLVGLFLHL
jgi:hypothetical protein